MQIEDSALKRQWNRADIEHAVTNAITIWNMDGHDMIIGPARDGTLLEIGITETASPSTV